MRRKCQTPSEDPGVFGGGASSALGVEGRTGRCLSEGEAEGSSVMAHSLPELWERKAAPCRDESSDGGRSLLPGLLAWNRSWPLESLFRRQLLEPQQCSASLCETIAHEGNVEAVPGSPNKAAAPAWFREDPNLPAVGAIHCTPGRKLS